MEANQVKIGGIYNATITGKLAPVKINLMIPKSKGGGWEGTNLKTNRVVRIKRAEDLNSSAKPPTNAASPANGKTSSNGKSPAKSKTPAKSSKSAKNVKSKTASTKVTNKVKKPDTSQLVGNDGQPKAMSMLDAAVRVLSESDEQGSNCQQLIQNMTAKGYWQQRKGKTPDRTLHSAINREIKTKQGDSRFKKAGRGMFTLA